HLVEPELLVVVGSDPFGGVDRSLFERRIDVAARNLLRNHAELLQRQSAGAADAHLQALEVGRRLDLLAEEAAHLRAGVAGREIDDVVVLEELAHQIHAAAVVHPRVLLAIVRAERNRAAERERRVLAEEVVRRRMRALDRAVLHGVDDAEGRHDLAARERLNLELVVGRRGDALGDELAAAEERIEALGPARRHAPLDLRLRLRERRRRTGGEYAGEPGVLDERSTFHPFSPLELPALPTLSCLQEPAGRARSLSPKSGRRRVPAG